MRFTKGLLVGLVAAAWPVAVTPPPGRLRARSPPGLSGPRTRPRSSWRGTTSAQLRVPTEYCWAAAAATQAGPAGAKTTAGALRPQRSSAASTSGASSASWDLLARAAKRQVPKGIWVKVHDGCPSASRWSGPTVIKAVTVFGNAAIVTETPRRGSRRGIAAAEGVFNYVHGRWGYSPDDLSIYQRGSVAADIAAAREAAGSAPARKNSTL